MVVAALLPYPAEAAGEVEEGEACWRCRAQHRLGVIRCSRYRDVVLVVFGED